MVAAYARACRGPFANVRFKITSDERDEYKTLAVAK
jgi:hypothetical protein